MSAPSFDDCRMALATAHYEQEYERAVGRTTHVLEIERGREMRMQKILLQFENDSLHSQLDEISGELVRTKEAESSLRVQFSETLNEVNRLKNILATSSHEIENLRSELASLGNTAVESKRLVDEKIRLSKELSNLRLEAERFRAQSISSQNIVAEKQALRRQLITVEEQLENEKRAHERAQSRETHQAGEIANLSLRLEEARKELAEQIQARERQERSARQQRHESEAQRAALEERIEDLNRKLRQAKDQLQEAQSNGQQRRNNLKATESPQSQAKSRAIPNRPMSTQFVPALTIATPGAIKSWNKGKQPTALPGDKSSFSITPFLKRMSEPQNSSVSSDDDLNELHPVTVCAGTPKKLSSDKMSIAENATIISPQQEDELLSREAPPSRRPKLSHHIGTKSKMTRAISSRSRSPQTDVENHAECADVLLNRASGHGQIKLKRRKLGFQRDRNLFEDEEDPVTQDIRKPGRKPAPGPGRIPRDEIQLTAQSSVMHGRGFGAPTGFSPLKRDRKRM
ncbi:uncharacterized protein CDV56_102195 [Aspergillus thermomutatus]|uniref:Uncharacterized protein n=1 Tax=Aspergillus thermomutatus TaxID=41047 RepID=A0A397GPG0_ASPTH|nr:uncharacterized protein CDV56_102195 [Aspergillus thermomutatus]RHZ49890.1 hypothetical protein CDV56_102195 [Aspergillus thermomutatus]